MLKKILFLSSLFLLVGCDDDSESVAGAEPQVETLSSVDDLPKCGDDNEGALVRVKGEASARICVENKWQFVAEPFKDTVAVANYTVYALGEDIECSTRELSDKSGIKVICNGDSIGVVYNGRDGEDGADGKNGKNGVNGKEGPQGKKGDKGDPGVAGVTGSDGEKGSDGSNGEDGKDGASCSLVEGENGFVTIICGTDSVVLYKALCGGKSYDPETHFCIGEVIFPKCKGSIYNPEKEICIEDVLVPRCGEVTYDPEIQVCEKGTVLPKCGEIGYDPEIQVCENGIVLYTCKDVEYDAESYFCDNRDKKIYRYVTIGEQVWMAENLNYETEGSFCFNDSVKNCAKYGRLYTWAAAMDSAGLYSIGGKGCGLGLICDPIAPVRGVCPEGMHLPTASEWILLRKTAGSAEALMAKGYSEWPAATNESGLSLIPSGLRQKGYGGLHRIASLWSSTEKDADSASRFHVTPNGAGLSWMKKDERRSVRCVKD